MDFIPLQLEQKKSFEEDGFLVIRNALDPPTNQQVLAACDRKANSVSQLLTRGKVLNKPWYNDLDFRPGLLEEKALYNLVTQSTTVSLIVQLLSPNIHLHSTALTYKRPENPDYPPYRRGWHRDMHVPRDLGSNNLPRVGIKVCYCLSDFSVAGAGMTLFARGSHLRNEPLKIPKGQVDPPDHEVCELKLNAGDAVLFENRVFHTAIVNRTENVAKRIIYGYAYRWMKQEVYIDTLEKQSLKNADPITRQLIGWNPDVESPPWALQDWAKKHNIAKERTPYVIWE